MGEAPEVPQGVDRLREATERRHDDRLRDSRFGPRKRRLGTGHSRAAVAATGGAATRALPASPTRDGQEYDGVVMKVAGVIALVGGVANLLLGSLIFRDGFAGARWCVAGTPEPDSLDTLIPLLYEIGVGACGIAGGIALVASRGSAVRVVASSILILAGFALVIPRSIYSHPFFGPLAITYARYGWLLLLAGLAGTTLPGAIAVVTEVRRYVSIWRSRTAAA
jgi:hypothetical protein